ncbi:MAG: ABC transporter ATP-binding protein [Candidatus Nomurabacteria bacterium]|nr:ABC transporter ATP-binding protein [Candidatus Nomurabacteria bacterium]
MFNFRSTISYIRPVFLKYKWAFVFIFILHAFRTIISNIINPLFYKRIIDVISDVGLDRAAFSNDLYNIVFLIALFLPFGWVLGRSTQFLVSRFQSKVIRDLHDFSFAKLHNHSYLFFADNFSGSLVNKSRKFVRAFEVMHDITIDNFWSSVVIFISIFTVFFIEAPKIALAFFAMAIFYIAIIFFVSKKKVEYDAREAAADSRVTGYLADSITNAIAVKSSAAGQREIEGFKKFTSEDFKFRSASWNFGNKQFAIQSGIIITMQIIAVFITARLWLDGAISAGVFILVQSYSITLGHSLWDLGRAMTKFSKAYSDMKEMVDIFKQIPDVLDISNPEVCKIKEGEIEIKDISFDYGAAKDVFKDFSLKINAGEKIGLVGYSGSGKSTITKLLMRFLDIQKGLILIDGQNISKIKQDDLRRNISYIPQEPILFHRTIKENILYSFPEATDEQVIQAAKKAHAHEFIIRLTHGYDTLVGERGIKLSGGERQRVAIARAMLKPAPILILDEATSSLDSISETYIQEAFSELMKGKTTIVIAHRLSTVQKMDRIIVLNEGKIVEQGTHTELLAKNGSYAELWNHQTGGFLEDKE